MTVLLFVVLIVAVVGAAIIGTVALVQHLNRQPPVGLEVLLGPVISVSPDAMIVASTTGKVELVNRPAEKLFGYAPGRMIGLNLDELIPDRFHSLHHSHYKEYFNAPRTREFGATANLSARRIDGTEIRVEIGLAPVAVGRVVAVLREVRGG